MRSYRDEPGRNRIIFPDRKSGFRTFVTRVLYGVLKVRPLFGARRIVDDAAQACQGGPTKRPRRDGSFRRIPSSTTPPTGRAFPNVLTNGTDFVLGRIPPGSATWLEPGGPVGFASIPRLRPGPRFRPKPLGARARRSLVSEGARGQWLRRPPSVEHRQRWYNRTVTQHSASRYDLAPASFGRFSIQSQPFGPE